MVIVEVVSGAKAQNQEISSQTVVHLAADPRFRGDLANIIGRALRTEPEQRYRSAGELADDLDRFLAGMPVDATRPTIGYRLGKLIQRHRVATAAVVVASGGSRRSRRCRVAGPTGPPRA